MDYRMKQEVKREVELVLAKAAEDKVAEEACVVKEVPVVEKKPRVRRVKAK